MKKTMMVLVVLLWAFGGTLSAAKAQPVVTDTSQMVLVKTRDGNRYMGHIVSQDAAQMVLKTDQLGVVSLQKDQLVQIKTIRKQEIVDGEYWPENPHATRYLFGPNGYGLRKGEGYYSNTWIFFNQLSYGFTDNFTVGAGVIPLFLFAGAPTPIWITPKFSIPVKKDVVNLGVGGLFATVLGGEDVGTFGIAYGQLTLGSRDRNVNFGLGYGYAGSEWANTPTLSFSGVYRAGKRFALLSENYLFDTGENNVFLLSAGGRYLGDRLAIDGALILPTQTDGELFAIPWLGISVPFGNTQ